MLGRGGVSVGIVVGVVIIVAVLAVLLALSLFLALLVELIEHLLGLLHDLDEEELGCVLRLRGAGRIEDFVGSLDAQLAEGDLGLDQGELVIA
jgi:hypothetical protein